MLPAFGRIYLNPKYTLILRTFHVLTGTFYRAVLILYHGKNQECCPTQKAQTYKGQRSLCQRNEQRLGPTEDSHLNVARIVLQNEYQYANPIIQPKSGSTKAAMYSTMAFGAGNSCINSLRLSITHIAMMPITKSDRRRPPGPDISKASPLLEKIPDPITPLVAMNCDRLAGSFPSDNNAYKQIFASLLAFVCSHRLASCLSSVRLPNFNLGSSSSAMQS